MIQITVTQIGNLPPGWIAKLRDGYLFITRFIPRPSKILKNHRKRWISAKVHHEQMTGFYTEKGSIRSLN